MAATAAASAARGSARLPAAAASAATATITKARSADICTPVTTANAHPPATVAASRHRRASPRRETATATAAQTIPRWSPDTAKRCDSPSTLKSSSVGVSDTRVRSPSRIPDIRSPPGPATLSRSRDTRARHRAKRPSTPGRHPDTDAVHARPSATRPLRAEERAHLSPASAGFSTAPNSTTSPGTGRRAEAGQPTLTSWCAPGPPPESFTSTRVPNRPTSGSATTTPVHRRAPASRHSPAALRHA